MEIEKINQLYNLLDEFYMNLEHTEEENECIDLTLDCIYQYTKPSFAWSISNKF